MEEPEVLVPFWYKDGDVIWNAYYRSDRAGCVTVSDLVIVLYDAKKISDVKEGKKEESKVLSHHN